MMQKFNKSHLDNFTPNEWSDPANVMDQLGAEGFITHSLIDASGATIAIACFTKYWGNNWHGFFLVSKAASTSQLSYLRQYVRDMMREHNMDRLQSDSQDNATLNRWHQFLGLKHEGTRRRLLYGKDYNMWALLREEI